MKATRETTSASSTPALGELQQLSNTISANLDKSRGKQAESPSSLRGAGADPGKTKQGPAGAELAMDLFLEHSSQIHALTMAIEGRLAEECNDGDEPLDGTPLTTWRLAQVLLDMVASTCTENAMRSALGLKEEARLHSKSEGPRQLGAGSAPPRHVPESIPAGWLTDERSINAALSASYEADALLKMALHLNNDLVQDALLDDEHASRTYQMRGCMGRLQQLNHVVMLVLGGDDTRPENHFEIEVYGHELVGA